MMTEYKPNTFGTRCKACDRMLESQDLDPELCHKCLAVVHEINEPLYEEVYKRQMEEEVG